MKQRLSAAFAGVCLISALGCGGDTPAPAGEIDRDSVASSGGAQPGSPSTPAPTTTATDTAEARPQPPAHPRDPDEPVSSPAVATSPPSTQPASTPAQPPAPPVGQNANDILERAEQAYDQVRSMEADFVQEVYVPLLESTQHSRGRLFHRAPDRFLMRFSEPAGDLVVADGEYVWMYYPSNDPRQVMRAPLTQDGQQVDFQREFLSDATDRFTATRTGTESVGGRQAHALTLLPRGPSPYTEVKIWVDAQDNLVRRFEITEQNQTVRKLEMSGLRINVLLADDLFEFTPPPGTQVFQP